ncbi:TonB-dependent receptor [Maribacter sp. ANRC-HE7]|uniref:TonB-dependent receptor n=1 Tax=Maribacter aquimaris TaxID=2737171 RepID=A0ABR7V505_9FLAO|nr:TonB-dependent receptor [Maribacter aquimaris]MBD0779470.1 TonB-dependent receptor [Maribacter aquimaris]
MKFSVNMDKVVFLLFFIFLNAVTAQEIRVLDYYSKEPIVNVAVYNQDKSKAALSDLEGVCDISVFSDNERITFKHLSYEIHKATKIQLLRNGAEVYLVIRPEELDEVVMSISKWEQQKKDIPHKIVALNARAIAFTNPQTSADLLQNSGKVFVQKSQLGGGSPMIRGFATNRLLLTVDGVRMNNAIFRGGNLQNVISIDPFNIEKTEVIFGPGSVIYGSDALGGVMNFYTKRAIFSHKDSLEVSGHSNLRYASANNERTGHFDINLGKKKWAFLTGVSYNDFDDLKMGSHGPDSYKRNNYVTTENGLDVLTTNSDPRKQVSTGYDQWNFMQKITHKPNNNWGLDMGLFYSETSDYSRYDRLIRPDKEGSGLRSAEWYYGPQKWFMGNVQLNKKGKGKFYDGLKITTAYQYFEESRNDRGFQDAILYSTREMVHAFSTNVDFENKKIGDLRLYYGTSYVLNKVGSDGSQKDITTNLIADAPSRYPDGSSWQTAAAYLNGEYKAKPNFSLLSGLRYSHVWINADFDKTFYPFPFDDANLSTGALTGSIGFSWFPRANLQVTLNGSTGFRSPNIDDVGKVFDSEPGSVVVPNPDLEPEYAYNMELGVQKNYNDKVVFKGAAFYTYLVDALVRRDYLFNGESQIEYNGELSTVQAMQNAAKAYVYGFEFGLEAFLTENISLVSNLTLTEGIEEEEDGTDSPSRHVPPTFGDVHFVFKNQNLKTDFFLNFNGEIANDDLATSEQAKTYMYAEDANGLPYSPSWYTLNLRTQYRLNKGFAITCSLENMTNQLYRSYSSGIASPGTNLILGVDYSF